MADHSYLCGYFPNFMNSSLANARFFSAKKRAFDTALQDGELFIRRAKRSMPTISNNRKKFISWKTRSCLKQDGFAINNIDKFNAMFMGLTWIV